MQNVKAHGFKVVLFGNFSGAMYSSFVEEFAWGFCSVTGE